MNGVTRGKRILGLDFARALAIWGMIIVNFKTVLGAGKSGPDWLTQMAGLLEGRAAATFVVLAGVGISLLASRGRLERDRHQLARHRGVLLRRALFLFLGGLLFCTIWPPDILHFYGVYITMGCCFLWSSDKKLLGAAIGAACCFPLLLLFFNYETGWNWETLEYHPFWTFSGMTRNLFFNGFHPVFPWVAFLLSGMWLGRKNLRCPHTIRRIFLGGLLLSMVVESLSRGLVYLARANPGTGELHALLSTNMMPPMPFYVLAGVGAACVVISASIYLVEAFPNHLLVTMLVPTGQMALTHYMGHVVFGLGFLGLMGRLQDQSLVFAMGASCIFMVLAVVFSVLWQRRFSQGPMEWFMRAATHGRSKAP